MLPHDPDCDPQGATETDDSEDAPAPCANALIVGTFALMTRWAATPENARAGDHPQAAPLRGLLARKIVSNLFFLMSHPAVPVPMARALANAHAEWVGLAGAPAEPPRRIAPIATAEPRPADVTLH